MSSGNEYKQRVQVTSSSNEFKQRVQATGTSNEFKYKGAAIFNKIKGKKYVNITV
ncbi:MAG: hypothetical protein GX371_11340 [Bacteroidales bacterium]|nr:hypothetical protein [Bacteroidales bacterium]